MSWLETALDGAAAAHPDPGRPAIHRLNRTEYVNAIRDLLGLEIDGRSLLPGDNADVHGFDNNADILSVSPVLMERYLSAARTISRLVVGRATTPDFYQHRVHKWMVQEDRMSEDLPFGSRGGTAVPYFFPADGEYDVQIELQRTGNQHIRGLGAEHLLDVRLDGALIERFTIGGEDWVALAPPESYSGNINVGRTWENYSHNMDRDLKVRVLVKAGRRVVGVSFVGRRWALEGLIVTQPQVGVSRSRNEIPDGNPSVASVTISGPLVVTGPGDDTLPRRKIFVCRPSSDTDEAGCAREILSTLARRAYRRPVAEGDVQTLMRFYETGRADGSFDAGIQFALERLLVSPAFLFRIEQDPAPGAATAVHRISDIELASRLSFFLWSSIPDDALLDAAERGTLEDPAVLEQQVRRMIADARGNALVENFVGQWLAVRNVRDGVPDADLFPEFDENLREAFHQETALFMESMLREDRSLVDLLDADYTFVNERLARHYGIPNVYGNQFRRVTLRTAERGGLLGHGSILTVTSYPNRTSPVLRGKWLLENFLGTPPPAPPPNIPALSEDNATRTPASVRERLEAHRRNPACAVCHDRMDPLGFALEHYDPIGASVALPLLDGMVPAFAAGQSSTATPVRRFGAVYVPNGMWMEQWTPATEGPAFEFSPTLTSLEPFRDAVTVVSGLSVAKNAGASLHSRASTRWLTGVAPREGQSQAAVYAGVSMDQIAAKALGHQTQLASLELALEPNDFAGSCDPGFSCAYVTTISWRSPTTPLPMEHNPRVVFERLFGDGGTTDPAARLARIKKDRSLLDSVGEEAARLGLRVGAGDRLKLNEYLDAIRDACCGQGVLWNRPRAFAAQVLGRLSSCAARAAPSPRAGCRRRVARAALASI